MAALGDSMHRRAAFRPLGDAGASPSLGREISFNLKSNRVGFSMSDNLGSTLPFLELKSSKTGEIEGYGSVFGVRDSHGDIVQPGAFSETLKRRRPVMLWAHRQDEPVGSWTAAEEDSRGLHLKGRLNLSTARGRDAFEHVKSGDISGLSIGFRIPEGGAEFEGRTRMVKEIDLLEVSLVSLPSNEAATVTEVRSALGGPVELEKLLASYPNVSRRLAQRIARQAWAEIQGKSPEEIEAEERAAREAAAMAEIARQITALANRIS